MNTIVGMVKLSLQYIPDDLDSFNTVTLERQIAVERRCPVLYWPLTVFSIEYGTPLSEQHLCVRLSETQNSSQAMAALKEGKFVYQYNVGHILPAGECHTLTVEFIPPPAALNRFVRHSDVHFEVSGFVFIIF